MKCLNGQVNLIEHTDPGVTRAQTELTNPPGSRISNLKRGRAPDPAEPHPGNRHIYRLILQYKHPARPPDVNNKTQHIGRQHETKIGYNPIQIGTHITQLEAC
jgi:hypothetical protein